MTSQDSDARTVVSDALRNNDVTVPVESGKYYAFSVSLRDVAADGGATAVAQIRFLNQAGEQLRGPYAGAQQNDKHGPFVSFTQGDGDEVWSRSIVRAPEGAESVLIRARKARGTDEFQFTAPPKCVNEILSARHIRTVRVSDGNPFRVRACLKDSVGRSEAGVVQLVYRDRNGKAIDASYPGATHSERYPNYIYVSSGKDGHWNEIDLVAPSGAAELVLHLHIWKGSDDLEFVGEVEAVSALPPGLVPERWLAVVGEQVVVACIQTTDSQERAKPLLLRVPTTSPSPSSEVIGSLSIEFFDAGTGAAVGARVGPFPVHGTDGDVVEAHHMVYPPSGDTSVRLTFSGKNKAQLSVGREVTSDIVDILPAENCRSVHGSDRFELRAGASEAWRAALNLKIVRPTPSDGSLPEMAIFFGDSNQKTLAVATLIEGEYSHRRSAGNVAYFRPNRASPGVPGLEVLSLSLSFLPAAGAHEMIARITPGGSGSIVAVQWDSNPFTKLVQQSVQPALAQRLSGMEHHSRDATLATVDALVERFGAEAAVLSASIDSCRRLGDTIRLKQLTLRAAELTGTSNARLRLKARLAASMLDELEPSYLPVAGRVRKVNSAGRNAEEALRVGHLFKTTVPYENTGGAIRCKNIVNYQKRMGLAPSVVTPLGYPNVSGAGDAWHVEHIEGVPYYRLSPVSREALKDVPVTKQLDFNTLLLTRVLQRYPVDVLQASSGYRGYEQALIGLSAAKALDIPFVYEVRSYHEHCWRGMTDWILEAELTKARLRQEDRCMIESDAVVTICETMKNGLIERGVAPEKIFVVPNSVDISAFQPAPIDVEFRHSLGLRADVTVGYISNVSSREGHSTLLEAVSIARQAGASVDCLIVGDGPRLQSLKDYSAELGIAPHVVFTGEVPHDSVAKYYGAIDIFVVPRVADFASDYVTPMKPFEAMAMERCVIISDRPALREIVEPGVRGGMFRAGDSMDLANKIVEFSRDAVLRARYAQEGRRWVEQERTWDRTIQIYKEVYAAAEENFQRRKRGG